MKVGLFQLFWMLRRPVSLSSILNLLFQKCGGLLDFLVLSQKVRGGKKNDAFICWHQIKNYNDIWVLPEILLIQKWCSKTQSVNDFFVNYWIKLMHHQAFHAIKVEKPNYDLAFDFHFVNTLMLPYFFPIFQGIMLSNQ